MWYMKALAILTVVMAHCTFTDSNIQRLTDIFGTIGVPIFLIIGGIYFRVNHEWKKFAYQKTKRIVVPWILWGGLPIYYTYSVMEPLLTSMIYSVG